MKGPMKRIAAYARVSTKDRQNPEGQLERIREYLRGKGVELEEHVEHVSGAARKRTVFDELMARVRRGELDGIAVVRIDRLARSVGMLAVIGTELQHYGADLIVTDQAIDTTTSAGKLQFHVLAAVAEFERDLIRERTRDGMGVVNGVCRSGKRAGRPLRPIDMERARELVAEVGKTRAAEILGVPRRTLHRRLRNEETEAVDAALAASYPSGSA